MKETVADVYHLKPSHPRWLWWLGLPFVAVSLLLMMLSVILAYSFVAPGFVTRVSVFGAALIIGCGYLLYVVGSILLNVGRRFLAVRAEYATLRDDRPPVLYLRSFVDDPKAATRLSKRRGFSWFAMLPDTAITTEEEGLFKLFRKFGPPITIGTPGEILPRVGMPRLYVSQDQWKQTVEGLMKSAQVVVIRAGMTNGVLHEIELASRNVEPQRLVFLLPFAGRPNQFEDFRRLLMTLIPCELPMFYPNSVAGLSFGGILYFGPDWSPHLIDLYYQSLSKTEHSSAGRISTIRFLKTAFSPVFDHVSKQNS